MLGCLIFFGGLCQFLTGIVHLFRAGGGAHSDTFAATVFPSYGAFNLAYALMYLPGSGILAAYTDDSATPGGTAVPTREFYDAMGVWYWAWFIVTVIFLVGAMRTNRVVVCMLGLLALELALLAVGSMMGGQGVLSTVGSGLGFVVSGLACESSILHGPFIEIFWFNESEHVIVVEMTLADWVQFLGSGTDYAGAAGLWGSGATPFKLPMFPMHHQDDDRQLA